MQKHSVSFIYGMRGVNMCTISFTLVLIINQFLSIASQPRNQSSIERLGFNQENALLFEGDIVLPPGVSPSEASRRVADTWPNGIIPYEFDQGYSFSQQNRIVDTFRQFEALVSMNNFSCVQFRPKVYDDTYFITISHGVGCSSYVGQNRNYVLTRRLTLNKFNCLDDYSIMHQLMHVLGFYHEHTRYDRDQYIVVNTANVRPNMRSQLNKHIYPTSPILRMPYDYNSIMHASQSVFSMNGFATLLPVFGYRYLGSTGTLSTRDIQAVRRLYNCTERSQTTTSTTTTSPAPVRVTYDSVLTSNDLLFTRFGSSGEFYYQTFGLYCYRSGLYQITSNSSLDTYGYLFQDTISQSNYSSTLIAFNDDGAGNLQFNISLQLEAYRSYILLFTTYSPRQTGAFRILVNGPSWIYLYRTSYYLTVAPTYPTSVANIITTPVTSESFSTESRPGEISSSYFGTLFSNESTISRPGRDGSYFYDTILVVSNTSGNFTFTSSSSIDTYGYLFANYINTSNYQSSLIKSDDDSGGDRQFSFSYPLIRKKVYILLFTTFSSETTGRFSVNIQGPSSVWLLSVNLGLSSTQRNRSLFLSERLGKAAVRGDRHKKSISDNNPPPIIKKED